MYILKIINSHLIFVLFTSRLVVFHKICRTSGTDTKIVFAFIKNAKKSHIIYEKNATPFAVIIFDFR